MNINPIVNSILRSILDAVLNFANLKFIGIGQNSFTPAIVKLSSKMCKINANDKEVINATNIWFSINVFVKYKNMIGMNSEWVIVLCLKNNLIII